MSRPVSVIVTPAIPVSPASRTPLSVLAGVAGELSAYTEPAIDASVSPKSLFADPPAGRPVIVMALLPAVPLALPVP